MSIILQIGQCPRKQRRGGPNYHIAKTYIDEWRVRRESDMEGGEMTDQKLHPRRIIWIVNIIQVRLEIAINDVWNGDNGTIIPVGSSAHKAWETFQPQLSAEKRDRTLLRPMLQ